MQRIELLFFAVKFLVRVLRFRRKLCLFFSKHTEKFKGERKGEKESTQIGYRLTSLYPKKMQKLWHNQHGRDIEQALSGDGKYGSVQFIAECLIGDTCHKVQRKQGHTNTLQTQGQHTDFRCFGRKAENLHYRGSKDTAYQSKHRHNRCGEAKRE